MPKHTDSLLKILIVLCLVLGTGCGGEDDPATPAADTTAPAAVSDLRIQSLEGTTVTIAWTAPGDDGDEGTADRFDVRWSFASITATTWATDTSVAGVPAPGEPGTAHTISFDVAGKADVHVGLKTADEADNWSDLSNVISGTVSMSFVIQLLTDDESNDYPCVNNRIVTWIKDSGIDGEDIYSYDLEDPTAIITRRTGSGGQKQQVSNIDQNWIVWAGRENSTFDWEIHACNHLGMCANTQVTDNDVDDLNPIASRTGNYYWQHGDTMFEEIRYWNSGSGQDLLVSGGCCPVDSWSNSLMDVDLGTVVWRSFARDLSEIKSMLREGAVGTIYDLSDIINANTAMDYSLDDGDLAYESSSFGTWIHYWDGLEVHPIAEGNSPSLDDGRIAYEVWVENYWQVHYWDGTTIHEITEGHVHNAQPCLYGDWLVWVRRTGGGPGHIYYTRVSGP